MGVRGLDDARHGPPLGRADDADQRTMAHANRDRRLPHVGDHDGGDDAACRFPDDLPVRYDREPEAARCTRASRRLHRRLSRRVGRIRDWSDRPTMVSTGLPSREPDGGEYVDLVDFGVVASGGALPVLHSQVCLPPLLPVPNWLPHDAVETWHRRRIGHGRQAWSLLSWLLLGAYAAAVRGRCHEPPVDRGTDGGRRSREAATCKHVDYPRPRGLSGDGGPRSPHLVARHILLRFRPSTREMAFAT